MALNKFLQIVLGVIGVFVVLSSLFFLYQHKNEASVPGVGVMCGGFANIQCPVGLSCVYPKGVASFPDQAGTCQTSGISIPSVFQSIQKWFNRGIPKIGKNTKPSITPKTSEFPIVGDDGTVTNCIEYSESGYCLRIENIYSVSKFLDPGVVRGEEVKVKGVADAGMLMCTLIACSKADPFCNICSGELAIRDKSDTAKGNLIKNVVIEGSKERLSCFGKENSITCNGPLTIGQEYIFTGILDGEIKYYDNGEPYIVDTFVIRKYEPVEN